MVKNQSELQNIKITTAKHLASKLGKVKVLTHGFRKKSMHFNMHRYRTCKVRSICYKKHAQNMSKTMYLNIPNYKTCKMGTKHAHFITKHT